MELPGTLFEGVFQSWQGINVLSLLITFFFVTVLYMLALGLNLPNVKRWAKGEYLQVLAGFLIIISIVLMLNIAWDISQKVTQQVWWATGEMGNPTPFEAGKLYLDKVIECETTAYTTLYYVGFALKPFESGATDVAGVDPIGGGILSGPSSLQAYLSNRLTWLFVFQYFIYELFNIFEKTMLTMFLPAGLILRAFPLSRGAGGLLISIAIGCYFIFPMAYVSMIAIEGNSDAYCTSLAKSGEGIVSPKIPSANDLVSQFLASEDAKVNEGKWKNLLFSIGENISALYTQAMFYPLVALIITFTFVRSTATLFGADLAELGRGLLKLI